MLGLLRSNILLTSRGRRFRRLVAKIFNLDSSSSEHSKSESHYHMETKPHARVKTIKTTSTCPELFNLFFQNQGVAGLSTLKGGAVKSKVEFYCNDAYNIFMPKMATLTTTNSTFAIPMLSTHCAGLVSCASSPLHTSNHVPLAVI